MEYCTRICIALPLPANDEAALDWRRATNSGPAGRKAAETALFEVGGPQPKAVSFVQEPQRPLPYRRARVGLSEPNG